MSRNKDETKVKTSKQKLNEVLAKEYLFMKNMHDAQYLDLYNRTLTHDGISGSIHTRISSGNYWYVVYKGKEMKNNEVKKIGNYSPSGHNASSVVDVGGVAPTVMGNHGTVTAVVIPNDDDVKGKCHKIGDLNYYNYEQDNRIYSSGYCRTAITTKGDDDGRGIKIVDDESNLKPKIRKLTSKECYRLMGFSDLDWERASEVITESRIYHTAGDSIVVNVIEELIKQIV